MPSFLVNRIIKKEKKSDVKLNKPEKSILDLTLKYKKEIEISLANGVSKSERIFIARILGAINDNVGLLEDKKRNDNS